jgi:hypothetical protein
MPLSSSNPTYPAYLSSYITYSNILYIPNLLCIIATTNVFPNTPLYLYLYSTYFLYPL